jgi:hypothetical protein
MTRISQQLGASNILQTVLCNIAPPTGAAAAQYHSKLQVATVHYVLVEEQSRAGTHHSKERLTC